MQVSHNCSCVHRFAVYMCLYSLSEDNFVNAYKPCFENWKKKILIKNKKAENIFLQ